MQKIMKKVLDDEGAEALGRSFRTFKRLSCILQILLQTANVHKKDF